MNGARCFIDDFEYVTRKDNTLKLKRIWVVFPEPGTGSLLREDCKRKGITNKNPLAVPISEIKESFEIPRIRIKVTRTQFPLVVCFCMTSYKSQGQTLEAVILDFKEAIAKHGHFYVGVTRVRNSEGLFVKNFKPSQVLCRDDVKKQILILRKTKNYKFSKTYLDTKIWDSPLELRVGYININGLFHKINYLDKDYNIRNLDYLCIAETKLDNSILDDQIDQNLEHFSILQRQDVKTVKENPHMGMLILKNKKRSNSVDIVDSSEIVEYSGKKMQMSRLNICGMISVMFVYINKTPVISETKAIGNILAEQNVSVVLGDFNIDRQKDEGRTKISILEKRLGMSQLNKVTTRYRATLDLLFRKEMKETDLMTFSFENLYSDHSAIGFRYCKNGKISDDYKAEKILVQDKDFLRKITIESENKIDDEDGKHVRSETNLINQAFDDDDVIFECPRDIVKLSNLKKLTTGEWLDNHLINCYMILIEREYPCVLTLDTFFNIQLETRSFEHINRQFRTVNMFEFTLWLVPINCNDLHWFLLAVDTSSLIDNQLDIKIYDSSPEYIDWKKIVDQNKWQSFLKWKHNITYGDTECQLRITFNEPTSDIPLQTNGIDCGVFSLMYAKYLAAGKDFDFSQEDMMSIRYKIQDDLSAGKLKNHNGIEGEDFARSNKESKRNDSNKSFENTLGRRMPKDDLEAKDPLHRNRKDNEDFISDQKQEEIVDITEEVNESIDQENLTHTSQLVLKIIRFVNPGGSNLCFSNAVTSLLLNTVGIRNIITGDMPLHFENSILKELQQLHNMENMTHSSTKRLRTIVDTECQLNQELKFFDDNNQHDAAEFLLSLLQHLLVNENGLIDYLFGRTTSAIYCCNEKCNRVDSQSYTEVKIIMLPLIEETLESNLRTYFDGELLERTCSQCNHDQGQQVISFTEDPQILVFQLKRFRFENNQIFKIGKEIVVPLHINLESGSLYQIIGTINHVGNSSASGHYTSTVYDESQQKFYFMNDEVISELQTLNEMVFGQSLSETIYMIFYRRV